MNIMKRSTRQAFLCSLLLMAGLSGALAQKTPAFIYPSTPFNEEEAAKQMEEGTATISGIAKIKRKAVPTFPGKRPDQPVSCHRLHAGVCRVEKKVHERQEGSHHHQ
ncbi:hypothetical protein [Paraflavitalea speifideaquila]|uniref:hypothetical protein n=1 Tax=Paraflavitalea speifideaquila TaxID=3076558 RepID=UPI0028EC9414|nr:hypothetical protein [Paraflavitalea speifideiaquila]